MKSVGVVYAFQEGAIPSRFQCQEKRLVVYNRIMACFGPFGTKNTENEWSKIKVSNSTFKFEVVHHQLVWRSGFPLLEDCARFGFESLYPTGVGFGLWFLKKK